MAERINVIQAVRDIEALGLTVNVSVGCAHESRWLRLEAQLTRHDFNSGQPLPVFWVFTDDEAMIRKEFFDTEVEGYVARKAAGGHLQAEYFSLEYADRMLKKYREESKRCTR